MPEFTVEAGRPDTLDPEIFAMLKDEGVDRICINPQTMKPETLKRIGRRHTVEEIRSIIGVDSLGYLDVGCLDKLADNSKCGFCNGCFTGKYPVEPPKKSQKSKFETKISAQK